MRQAFFIHLLHPMSIHKNKWLCEYGMRNCTDFSTVAMEYWVNLEPVHFTSCGPIPKLLQVNDTGSVSNASALYGVRMLCFRLQAQPAS